MRRALLSICLLIPFCAPALSDPPPQPITPPHEWSSCDMPPYLSIGNYYIPGVVLRSQVRDGRLLRVVVECYEARAVFNIKE